MTDTPDDSPYLLREPMTEREDRLLKAVMALKFGAYPAHGSGFVMRLIDGDLAALADALAAYRSKP